MSDTFTPYLRGIDLYELQKHILGLSEMAFDRGLALLGVAFMMGSHLNIREHRLLNAV